MALSDLCDRLRSETGNQIAAGPTVADEGDIPDLGGWK